MPKLITCTEVSLCRSKWKFSKFVPKLTHAEVRLPALLFKILDPITRNSDTMGKCVLLQEGGTFDHASSSYGNSYGSSYS